MGRYDPRYTLYFSSRFVFRLTRLPQRPHLLLRGGTTSGELTDWAPFLNDTGLPHDSERVARRLLSFYDDRAMPRPYSLFLFMFLLVFYGRNHQLETLLFLRRVICISPSSHSRITR